MTPEWDRFVTAVKLNKGLKETNHEQLYAYLKQHEKHAAYDRLINDRFNPTTNDPLALVLHVQPHTQISHVQSHQYPSPSSSVQPLHVQPHSDGRVVVQNVQGRQNQNQGNFARGTGAAGNGGAQNRAGNVNQGQGKLIKCYNCGGEQANTHDADVDDQPIQDMAQHDPNIFQADDCDALDLDVDDEPTAQTIFMANLSSVVSSLQQAGPSNASILSEVLNLENSIDHHEIPNEVQQTNLLDSNSADMGNCNVIPYE
ncbi:hypothetical protein Tco_1304607 [Tanacetum coccineum]